MAERPRYGLPRAVRDPDLQANLQYMLGLIAAGGTGGAGGPFRDLGTFAGGATLTPDFSVSPCLRATVQGNLHLADPVGVEDGGSYALLLVMDGTLARTLTWSTAWEWLWGEAALSGDNGAKDIATMIYDGSKLYGVMQNDFLTAPRGP